MNSRKLIKSCGATANECHGRMAAKLTHVVTAASAVPQRRSRAAPATDLPPVVRSEAVRSAKRSSPHSRSIPTPPALYKFVILSETPFVSRTTRASCAMRRVLCGAITARLARIHIPTSPSDIIIHIACIENPFPVISKAWRTIDNHGSRITRTPLRIRRPRTDHR
jgi:hypothetical protein